MAEKSSSSGLVYAALRPTVPARNAANGEMGAEGMGDPLRDSSDAMTRGPSRVSQHAKGGRRMTGGGLHRTGRWGASAGLVGVRVVAERHRRRWETESVVGFSDLYAGFKLTLIDQDGLVPRLPFEAISTVGTRSRGISNRDVEPTIKLIGS